MLDPKKISEMEQVIASMREVLPPLAWELYCGFTQKGFTELQALELTKAYVASFGKTY